MANHDPTRRDLSRWHSGIGLRLLVRVLLFSSAITLLLTLLQLYFDYRRDVGTIDRQISEIEGSYRRSLGEGLWNLDARQLELQVDGILHLPDIRFVEVRETTDRADPIVVTAGSHEANADVHREFRISHVNRGTEQTLGVLSIEATLDDVYRRLFDTAIVILISQGTKTFVVSLFVLYIVNRLITRHLVTAAKFVGGYDLRRSPPPLRLERRPLQQVDELDQLVGAFNGMCRENSRLYRDLEDREGKIRRLVDANILGICIWNLEGAIVGANEAFLHMLQYGREDVVSGRLRWTDLTPAEWRERDERAVGELRSTGTFQPFEKEYFRKDGSRMPVLIGGALFEESGNEGVAFVLDLTERKRSEQRRLTHHRVTRILAEAPTVEEAAPKILQAVCEGLGWDLGAWWGIDREAGVLRCAELWRSRSLEAAEFEAATRGSTFLPGSGLVGGVWASGAPAWIPDVVQDPTFLRASIAAREGLHAAFAFPILLGDEVLGVVDFVTREVREPDQILLDSLATLGSQIGQFIERKRAEQALRESEREARLIVGAIPGFIAVLSREGEVEFVNRQVLAYFGRTLEDLRDWKMSDAVHPDDLPHVISVWTRAMESGAPYEVEHRFCRADGAYRWFRSRGMPLRDGDGRVVRWYVLLTDIDDRKRSEAELREAYSELAHVARVTTMGELTASIAHEVKQPIAASVTSAQTALRWLDAQPPELGEVREALSRIVRAGKRAGDVIGRIRALVTKAPPPKEPVDINAAIREVVELTRGEAVKNGVSVRTDLGEGLPLILGDRVQLQQVILNLIINGIEAMTGVGEASRDLLISTSRDGTGAVLVLVADTGPGLAAGAPEQVFAAFYTTKPGGLGLGLSICRSIIEAHEGRLWARANEPLGAIFQFTLPAPGRPPGGFEPGPPPPA